MLPSLGLKDGFYLNTLNIAEELINAQISFRPCNT